MWSLHPHPIPHPEPSPLLTPPSPPPPPQVRRAATRILVALIGRYPDQLPPLYRAALPELVGRFEREREEGVKGDVFAAVGELLAQVGTTAGRHGGGGGGGGEAEAR